MNYKTGRIKSFEPIRVVAMAGVVFYHLNAQSAPYGYLGVVTLFVMAGYLSLHHVLQDKPRSIPDQLIQKWHKLFPPMIMMILTVSLLMIVFYPNFLGSYGGSVRASVLGLNNYHQLLSGDSYFQGQMYLKPLTHLWAIALEIQFYLLFILGVSRFYDPQKKRQWSRALIGISLVSIGICWIKLKVYQDPTPAYYGLESRLFSFTIGMLARQMTIDFQTFRWKRTAAFIGFSLSSLLLFTNVESMTIQLVAYSLLIAILLIVSFYDNSFLRSLGELSVFRWLSARSYLIYLWHYPIIAMGSRLLANTKLPAIVFMILVLMLSLFVADRSYRWHRSLNRHQINRGLSLVMALMLLIIPYRTVFERRADESFRQLEKELSQDEAADRVETSQAPTADHLLHPSATRSDFSESFITWFDQLNQISPEVDYSFDDFLRYRDIPVTLIGDSIAYIAQPHFSSYLPNIVTSAEKSRLLEEVDQYYFQLKQRGQIGDVLVVSFGSNSVEETDDGLEKIWQDLADKPMILVDLVMPYPVNEESRNKIIHEFAATHEHVYLASWYDYAKEQPDFFLADFMHPNDLGSRAFIHLITNQVIAIARQMEADGELKIQ